MLIQRISYIQSLWEGLPTVYLDVENTQVLLAYTGKNASAAYLKKDILERVGINIAHGTIHKILLEEKLAIKEAKKSKRRKWIRYERTYSNSLWHTDYKLLDDGRWFIAYLDDASRFVTAYGMFNEATSQHAIEVLHKAIEQHGKPAAIVTDRGTQFYANESQYHKKGVSAFEDKLAELEIKHIVAGVRHPQTNGKIERFFGEVQRKLPQFVDIMMRVSDPVDLFMKWYNYERPHMSLDWDNRETPIQAFERKMPEPGKKVIDEQTGEEYHVE